eukprot:4560148-Pleurochrysis_carterae.AAC.1
MRTRMRTRTHLQERVQARAYRHTHRMLVHAQRCVRGTAQVTIHDEVDVTLRTKAHTLASFSHPALKD